MPNREPVVSLWDPIDEPEEDPQRPRLLIFQGLVVLAFVVLIAQLWRLQIVEGPQYRVRADNNRFRLMPIEAPRGVIYDRNRILLVRNRPSYTVGIIPADLPADDPLPVYSRLASALKTDKKAIQDQVDKGRNEDRFALVTLQTNVPEDLAFTIEERHLELPGVHVVVQPTREYLDGSLTSGILGYLGPITAEQYDQLKGGAVTQYHPSDWIGQVGLEARLEANLRGQPGERQMEVDATGREVQTLGVVNPVPGQNLVLSIDLDLQRTVADLLSASLSKYDTAIAVAIDPRNGQVLSLVYLPTYDNNLFAQGIGDKDLQALLNDPHRPMLNAAIGAAYPPGEVFKAITAAGALQEGVVKPDTKVDCAGQLIVPSRFDPTLGTRFADTGTYGPQDLAGAFATGCRIYFYLAGGGDPDGKSGGLGIDKLNSYAELFGLGKTSGIDLDAEAAGFLPTPQWKKDTHNEIWYKGDTYYSAVGLNSILATPLQIANAYAAIANGGTLYRPQLVLQVTDDQGSVVRDFAPQVIRRLPILPDYLHAVRLGLLAAMGNGQAKPTISATATVPTPTASPSPGAISIAGQASTVDSGRRGPQGQVLTSGWFAGFAPADNPRIALVVFLGQGRGPEDAAPIAQAILQQYLRSPGGGQ